MIYKNASEVTKRRKRRQLRQVMDKSDLGKTLKKALSLDGNASGARIVEAITDKETSSELLQTYVAPRSEELSAGEALG